MKFAEDMTGMEAWSIVAPILASHMKLHQGELDPLDEAYVTVFGALRAYDDAKGVQNENNP